MKHATIIAMFVLFTAASEAQVETGLRIWQISRDTFDLTLTSVFRSDGQSLKAAFNHRRGRTFFASEGESIGPYTVISIVSSGKDTASSTLRDTRTSELFVLSLNSPLELRGWRARLVDTTTALLYDVRTNDEIPNLGLKVREVTESSVVAAALSGAGTVVVQPMSEEERSRIAKLWSDAEEQRADAAKAAEKLRREKEELELAAIRAAAAELKAKQQTISLTAAPKLFFGTEYRYPKSYAYYYTFEPGQGGIRPQPRVIAIPTEFETRTTGWSLEVSPADPTPPKHFP